jgi:hypothetical protein
MRKNLFFTIATVAALGSGLIVPLAAEAKSRTAVQHRAATRSTITSFSSSSAPTSSAPTSSVNVGVNHPAKK